MIYNFVRSNIIHIAADAIVLPANEHLKEGAGASRAIYEAAGRKALSRDCSEIGFCPTGSAVPTLAFGLNARYIIHAVVPRWKDGKSNEYNLLTSTYLSALNVADVMGCKSIAFPLLASGHNGFDKELAIKIATESMDTFVGANLEEAILVVYGDKIENFINTSGYHVGIFPEQYQVDKRTAKHTPQFQQIMSEGKEIAQSLLEDQAAKVVAKAIEWLKDEKNQKMIIEYATKITQKVLFKK